MSPWDAGGSDGPGVTRRACRRAWLGGPAPLLWLKPAAQRPSGRLPRHYPAAPDREAQS